MSCDALFSPRGQRAEDPELIAPVALDCRMMRVRKWLAMSNLRICQVVTCERVTMRLCRRRPSLKRLIDYLPSILSVSLRTNKSDVRYSVILAKSCYRIFSNWTVDLDILSRGRPESTRRTLLVTTRGEAQREFPFFG